MKISLKDFQPITENCIGCEKVVDEPELGHERCAAYINPSYWWSGGRSCPLTSKGILTPNDIAKMAIKEGLIVKEGIAFVYEGQKIPGGTDAVASLVRRNRNIYVDLKRKLGITDSADEQGKVRVGQQKQKKVRRG